MGSRLICLNSPLLKSQPQWCWGLCSTNRKNWRHDDSDLEKRFFSSSWNKESGVGLLQFSAARGPSNSEYKTRNWEKINQTIQMEPGNTSIDYQIIVNRFNANFTAVVTKASGKTADFSVFSFQHLKLAYKDCNKKLDMQQIFFSYHETSTRRRWAQKDLFLPFSPSMKPLLFLSISEFWWFKVNSSTIRVMICCHMTSSERGTSSSD